MTVLTVNLIHDARAIKAYCEYHRAVWPEVIQSLRDVGVLNMDIHLLGRQLIMVLEMRDGVDYRRAFAAHRSSSPRVAEWERLMKSLQEPSPDARPGEWWAAMESVFCLDPGTARGAQDQEPAIVHFADRSRIS
jgi:L-rhamnose mutarotase